MNVAGRMRRVAEAVVFPFLVPVVMHRATKPFALLHDSMVPTFRSGERILVLLLKQCGAQPLIRGDFVVFESWHDDEDYALKRVIACPGEEIAIHRHVVLVDGEPLDEPYAVPPTHGVFPPTRLAADEYFVMGDNRSHSCDSRVHGPIQLSAVIGRPFYRTWPLRRFGYVDRTP